MSQINNWMVYLLKCADDSLYCGISNQLDKRIKQHNGEIAGGAKYTSTRQPCVLVYKEAAATRSEASSREHVIKSMSRTEKLQLIATQPSKPTDD